MIPKTPASFRCAAAAFLLTCTVTQAQTPAFDLESLATCRDSWLEWSAKDPARFARATDEFERAYAFDPATRVYMPKAAATLFGFRVVAVDPESVGMAVGFAVQVEGTFAAVRPAFEKAIGTTCKVEGEAGGNQGCELKVRDEGTALLASATRTQTLVACVYKYEK